MAKDAPNRSRLLVFGLMTPAVGYWVLLIASETPMEWPLFLAVGVCIVASVAALMVAVTIRLRLPLVLVTWTPSLHVIALFLPDVLWAWGS